MSIWKGLRARLASLRPDAADARMEEEFRFHVEMETEQNIRKGMDPEEARRRALVTFGGGDRYREGMRDGRGLRWVSDLVLDARYAVRSMVRTPLVALVACVTIALGVGVTTALFSLTNALLLRPLPVPQPHELVAIQEHRTGNVSTGVEGRRLPFARYVQYREALSEQFSGVAAHRLSSVSIRVPPGDALPGSALLISANYFDVLRVQPRPGRAPVADDEAVVVLGYRAWQDWFGGSDDAIGRVVHVDGRPFTVAGVAPSGFGGTTFGTVPDVWVPHGAYAGAGTAVAEMLWVAPFGRMAAGERRAAVQAAADAAGRRIDAGDDVTVQRVELEPFTGMPGEGRRITAQFMILLLGAAALVLLIASANIASMLLARVVARRREIAVRLAMGAGRRRIIRQLLTESVVLFLAGGALGVLLAYGITAGISSMQAPGPGLSLSLSATPDVRVLVFALVVTLVPALVFGLMPALRATRPDLVPALKDGAPGGSRSGNRLRSAFVIGQLAMAVLLLVPAGLFMRALVHGAAVEPGFDPAGVVVAPVNIAPHGYDEERGRLFYDELRTRLAAQPHVESVALARVILLAGAQVGSSARAADVTEDARVLNVSLNTVDEHYFGTMRIPLVAGRSFAATDGPDAERVAVINRTMARMLWGDEDPIGRLVRSGAEYRVIGVAEDGRYVTLGEEPRAFMFVPFTQNYFAAMAVHVRSSSPHAAVMTSLREQLRAIDPEIALSFTAPLEEVVAISLFPLRFAGGFIGALGALGLILAVVGTWGLLMYSVAHRMRDFGIRMALGASAGDVTRGVVRQSLLLAGTGVLIGLAGAAALARALAGFIFGVSPYDPVAFTVAPAILLASALLAAWQPVRRAVRADPVRALRSD